jgi:transposase InsO family protein
MMDGGFFTFDDILAGQTQAPGVGLSQEGPVYRFNRRSNLTAKARDAAAKAPPGLTLAQIDRVGQTNFQAHHIFPVEVFQNANVQDLIRKLYPEGFDVDDLVVYLPKTPEAVRALSMAIAIRRPPPGCIHHTDRGSQYCAHNYQKMLRKHGFKVSMSRKGSACA